MDIYWKLIDSKHILNDFRNTLYVKPFKENVFVYFLQKKFESHTNDFLLQYGFGITSQINYSSAINIAVPNQLILAIFHLTLKLNTALLFAHTHPPQAFYPSESKVSSQTTFSETDLRFNKSIYHLLKDKFNYSLPVYFLVSNNESYSCWAYYNNQTFSVSIPLLDSYGIKQNTNLPNQ